MAVPPLAPPVRVRAVAAIPAAGLLAGAAAGLFTADLPATLPFIAFAIGVASAVWGWSFHRRGVLILGIGGAFFSGGALLAINAWQQAWRPTLRLAFEEFAGAQRDELAGAAQPDDADAAVATIVGRLRRDASITPNGVSLSLAVRDVWMPCPRPVDGGVLLTVAGEIAPMRIHEWRAGRLLKTTALLRRPSRYLNPGAADEERALARRGTTLVGSVKSGALVDVIEQGSTVAEAAAQARAFVRRAVASSVGRWSPRAAAVVTAIVIGDRAGLGDDTERRLQEAGTYHVVAISGGNIAILAGLTLSLFRAAGVLGRTAMLTAIAGLLAYAAVVGGGASVDRATLMAVVYFAGRAIDLRGPPFNTLAVVAGLLVAADPLTVADPAFLLTFGATTGILAVSSSARLQTLARTWRPVASLLAASMAAEAMLFPVSAAIFSRVTFAGLALNFIAIPMMAVAQVAGMAAIGLSLVSDRAASAAGWLAFVGAEGLVRSADLVQLAPFVTWRLAPPHWLTVVIYYICLLFVVTGRVRSRRALAKSRRSLTPVPTVAAIVGAGAALWILAEPWTLVASRGDGRLHVTFIDVGQGDAALIRFPRGAAFVVDTGGLSSASTFDIGDRVVAPVLRRAGVRRLDTLVFTHGDGDHIGGAPSLVHEFRPRDIWEGTPVPPLEPLSALRRRADEHHARWLNVQTGDRLAIDGVDIFLRHPPIADWERQDVRNDDSIVMELVWGDVSIVLTGDIGRAVEEAIAPLFPPAPLRILKVPHHGSLTSSSEPFIAALRPTIAVVSAGRANPFGHPAPAVVRRYQDAGAAIFRTDQDGAVMVTTDGRSIGIETYTGGRLFLVATKDTRP